MNELWTPFIKIGEQLDLVKEQLLDRRLTEAGLSDLAVELSLLQEQLYFFDQLIAEQETTGSSVDLYEVRRGT